MENSENSKSGSKERGKRRGMYCSDALWDRVLIEAKRQGSSSAWIVRRAVRDYLDRQQTDIEAAKQAVVLAWPAKAMDPTNCK